MQIAHILPEEIEAQSFAIIAEELAARGIFLPADQAPITMRAIHTSADFDYAENLVFSPTAIASAREALAAGATIVTDTNMTRAGIQKTRLAGFGGEVVCFVADEDVAKTAKAAGTTRAVAAVDKAILLEKPLIFSIGNAPTALLRLCEHIRAGRVSPALVIGAPVGFVNVVASKERLLEENVPYIVAKGRKGGSNIAAAICNALLLGLG